MSARSLSRPRDFVTALVLAPFALALAPCLVAATPGRAANAPLPSERGADFAAGYGATARTATPRPVASVLVLAPAAEEGQPAWAASGVADLLTETLERAGVATVETERRDELLGELGLAGAARLPLASACIAAREAGASRVVTGAWTAESPERLRLTVSVHDARRLRALTSVTAAGASSDAAAVAVRVARRLGEELSPGGSSGAGALLDAPEEAVAAWMQAAAEPELAREHLEAALRADPTFAPAVLALAHAHLDGGRPDEVVPLLARLPRSAPALERRRALVLEGRAWLALGENVAAVTALEDAVRRHPDRAALLWLAEAHLAGGQTLAASETARRVLARFPDDRHALDVLARAEAEELG